MLTHLTKKKKIKFSEKDINLWNLGVESVTSDTSCCSLGVVEPGYMSIRDCNPRGKSKTQYPIQSLPEGAFRKPHLLLCYHVKEVRIVALQFYLYKMRIKEYVAIK